MTKRDNMVATLMHPDKSAPAGMVFYDSLNAVRKDATVIAFISVVERGWLEMGLHGVLCLDGRPVLYLKESAQPLSSFDRIRLQRLFWNQGVANILLLADPTTVYVYSGLAKPQAGTLGTGEKGSSPR